MEKIKTAIILNGGKKTSEVFPGIPKALIEINGLTILGRQVEQLKDAGIQNIIVSTYHLADEIDQFLTERNFQNINVYSTKEQSELLSGGSIKNTLLNTFTDKAIILNGNSFIDLNIKSFIDFHLENKFENSIILTNNHDKTLQFKFEIKENEIINLSKEKTDLENEYINAGVYILNVDIFNITHLQKFSLEKEILHSLVNQNFGAYLTETKLFNIDNEKQLKEAEKSLK